MSQERPSRINTEAIKQAIDLVDFAERYTHLRQISRAGEYAGPCPRCGGEDRFHIKEQRFYCRQCYPRGGDVIDLVRLLHNVSFRDACQLLAADVPFFSERPTRQETPHQAEAAVHDEQTNEFYESARKTIRATSRRLFSADGRAGREYLERRGLTESTWRTFQLGFGTTFHPLRRRNDPAIFIPWLSADGKRVEALRHRFTDPHLPKQERYSLKPGSTPILFGLHTLRSSPHIVLVEGEFNCMAIQQCGILALSVGSQTGALHEVTLDQLMEILPQYNKITIWFDDPRQGQRLVERLSKAEPFRKEKVHVLERAKYDANEMLGRGELVSFLATQNIIQA